MVVIVVEGRDPDGRGRKNATALSTADGITYLYNGKRLAESGCWSRSQALPGGRIDLVLLHDQDAHLWKWLSYQEDLHAGSIARYTAVKREWCATPIGGRDAWIHRAVTSDRPLTEEDARQLITWASDLARGVRDVIPPPVLGGTVEEWALQLLYALLPFGMFWQAQGCRHMGDAAALVRLGDFDGLEREIVLWFHQQLGVTPAGPAGVLADLGGCTSTVCNGAEPAISMPAAAFPGYEQAIHLLDERLSSRAPREPAASRWSGVLGVARDECGGAEEDGRRRAGAPTSVVAL